MLPALNKSLRITVVSILISLFATHLTFAQSADNAGSSARSVDGTATLGVARMVDMNAKDVKDGSIISATEEKGPKLSDMSYDPQVLGVVSRDAAIILSNTGSENGIPIISTGQVYVLVSSKYGSIKKGDLITTSTIPGVGVKAVKSGYVIGMALEDYANPNAQQVEKIAIDLDLHYFNAKPTLAGSLTDIFKLALLPTKEGPTAIFKYIVAAGVALASLVLGFMSFGRTAAKGVEALGRNPSASRMIHLGIIFNISIVFVIAAAGLVVAFLILRL